MGVCSVDGCAKPARSRTADLCPMHYHRQYRHGSVEMVSVGIATGHGRRYVAVQAKGHPVAHKSGRAWAHRVALYDAIGPGRHPCHWCGVDLSWHPAPGEKRLDVDHLDGFGDNNDPANLVPSCSRCNGARASARRHGTLTELGFWSHNDTIAALRSGGRRAG